MSSFFLVCDIEIDEPFASECLLIPGIYGVWYSTGQDEGAKKSMIDPHDYDSPLELYDARVKAKELHKDSHQITILGWLEDLHANLPSYEPHPPANGLFSKVW